MRFFIFKLLPAIVLCAGMLQAGRVSGVILDGNSGNPVEAVRIERDGTTAAISDSTGWFTFYSADDTLSVLCIKPNYWITPARLLPGFTDTLYLPPVLYAMDGISVFGSASGSNSLELPVTPDRFERQQNPTYASTTKIVNSLPGISVKTYGGPAGVSTLSLYGGQGDRLAILVDGIRINNEQNGSADISQIPPQLLERAELYPYGASAKVGNAAMTGVVNFNVRNEDNQVSQTLGSYGRSNTALSVGHAWKTHSAGLVFGRNRFNGSYSFSETGAYYPASAGQLFTDFHTEMDQRFAYGRLSGRRNDLYYRISGMSVRSDRVLSGQIYAPPTKSTLGDELGLYSLALGSFKWKYLSSYKLSTLRYHRPPGMGPEIDSKSSLYTWQNQLKHYSHNSQYGIEIETVRNRSADVSFGVISWIDTSRTVLAATGEHSLNIGKTRMVVSGRIEVENATHTAVAASLSLSRDFEGLLRQSAWVISRNYKKPTFNDLFWKPFGDPELKSETSVNIYSRNKFYYAKTLFRVNLFYLHYNNLIQWIPQAGASALWRPENIQSGESYGYHLSVEKMFWERFRGHLDYDRNITRNYDISMGAEHYGKPFIYTPGKSVKGGLQVKASALELQLNYVWESPRIRLYGSDDLKLPAYGVLDASVKLPLQIFTLLLELEFQIENAGDEHYQLVLGYPQPGRTYTMTVRLKPAVGRDSHK